MQRRQELMEYLLSVQPPPLFVYFLPFSPTTEQTRCMVDSSESETTSNLDVEIPWVRVTFGNAGGAGCWGMLELSPADLLIATPPPTFEGINWLLTWGFSRWKSCLCRLRFIVVIFWPTLFHIVHVFNLFSASVSCLLFQKTITFPARRKIARCVQRRKK